MEDHANFDVNKEIVTERKIKQENKVTSSPNWTHTPLEAPSRPAVGAHLSMGRLPLLCTIYEGNEMPASKFTCLLWVFSPSLATGEFRHLLLVLGHLHSSLQ